MLAPRRHVASGEHEEATRLTHSTDTLSRKRLADARKDRISDGCDTTARHAWEISSGTHGPRTARVLRFWARLYIESLLSHTWLDDVSLASEPGAEHIMHDVLNILIFGTWELSWCLDQACHRLHDRCDGRTHLTDAEHDAFCPESQQAVGQISLRGREGPIHECDGGPHVDRAEPFSRHFLRRPHVAELIPFLCGFRQFMVQQYDETQSSRPDSWAHLQECPGLVMPGRGAAADVLCGSL